MRRNRGVWAHTKKHSTDIPPLGSANYLQLTLNSEGHSWKVVVCGPWNPVSILLAGYCHSQTLLPKHHSCKTQRQRLVYGERMRECAPPPSRLGEFLTIMPRIQARGKHLRRAAGRLRDSSMEFSFTWLHSVSRSRTA